MKVVELVFIRIKRPYEVAIQLFCLGRVFSVLRLQRGCHSSFGKKHRGGSLLVIISSREASI